MWRAIVFAALAAGGAWADTREFEKKLIERVREGVERWQQSFESGKANWDPARQAEGYTLAAMVNLHRKTGDVRLIEWAKSDLLFMAERCPVIHGFHLTAFIETFRYLRERKALSAAEDAKVTKLIRETMISQYDFPDWGAHNRSAVAATGFYQAARTLPDDPEAPKWRQFADAMMSESWGRWSVEDASMYQSFWLFHMLEGAEASGRAEEFFSFTTTRYYFDYYKSLLTPLGMMPEVGDADWGGQDEWYFANMVRGAAVYRNGEYQEHARRVFEYYAAKPLTGVGIYCGGAALKWLDSGLATKSWSMRGSHEATEDVLSKKIVFRNDKERDSAYLLLNYRDTGPYGRMTRDHLDQVLAAYEEKPHHGHADENAFLLFLDGGTLLLGDGGYRPYADYFGGWRADIFHNRIVARTGFPLRGDVWEFLAQDKTYHAVETEKIHFQTFGALDYSRTRLRDRERGYTADRIVLFVPSSGMAIVVDAIRIDAGGHKTFANVWHPENIVREGDGWFTGWPKREGTRTFWENAHSRELLIQFLDRRDKPSGTQIIDRRYNRSQVVYEWLSSRFFEGQWLTFITVLRPHAPGGFRESMLNEVEATPGTDRRSLTLRFAVEGKPVTVGLKLDQTIGLTNLRGRPQFDEASGRLQYGPSLETDADFAYVRENGERIEYGLMYGAALRWGGRVVWEMPPTAKLYQGTSPYDVPRPRAKMPVWRGQAAAR